MRVAGCLSCEVLDGIRTPPGGTIYEDDYWHVDSVLSPVVWQGFLIIKLKRHCEHIGELTTKESAALGPLISTLCASLTELIQPEKIYVCSFGDGVKHVHLWLLPRPQGMRPGMHWVMLNLDIRIAFHRWFGVKRWLQNDAAVTQLAQQMRAQVAKRLP